MKFCPTCGAQLKEFKVDPGRWRVEYRCQGKTPHHWVENRGDAQGGSPTTITKVYR